MAHRIRILGAFPTGQKNIVLTGKGVDRVAAGGDLFVRTPYEDPHAMSVRVGTVDVYSGTVAAPEAHLDLSGVWQASQAPGLKGQSQIATVANTAHVLDTKYFTLPEGLTGKLTVWFDDTGASVQPTVAGTTRYLKITIANNDTAAQVATKLATQLTTDAAYTGVATGASVLATKAAVGEMDSTKAGAGNSGFTVTVLTDGDNANAIEEVTANGNALTWITKVEWLRNANT